MTTDENLVAALDKQMHELEKDFVKLQKNFNELNFTSNKYFNLFAESYHEKLKAIEQRTATLEKHVSIIFDKMRIRVFQRNARNRNAYLAISNLRNQGHTVMQIAKLLGMPYSSCWKYANMTQEEGEALPLLEDAKIGGLIPKEVLKSYEETALYKEPSPEEEEDSSGFEDEEYYEEDE
jgi:hypothetical protein